MALDTRLRGYIEERIDRFMIELERYYKLSKFTVGVTTRFDFVLGFFYARIIDDAVDYIVKYDIEPQEHYGIEIWVLLLRRSNELIDFIKKELKK